MNTRKLYSQGHVQRVYIVYFRENARTTILLSEVIIIPHFNPVTVTLQGSDSLAGYKVQYCTFNLNLLQHDRIKESYRS
jgi:hypothetical protein